MSNTLRVAVAALSAIALHAGAGVRLAHAAPGDIYNLGTLGGTYSEGWSVNDAGQVAGPAYIPGETYRAFRYSGTPGSGGAMADLGTLGTGYSLGYGINSSGQVAGTSPALNNRPHAFRYSGTPGAGGAMADLGTMGGTFSSSYGRAINDAGQVAGYGEPAGGSDYHAFRYTGTPGSGGAMADLGTLGGNESRGFGINNAGQVTGYSQRTDGLTRAFLYTGTPGSGGAMVDLGTLGGLESSAGAINNAGQVTGAADTTLGFPNPHAFRYTPGPDGGMVDLGAGHGNGINDAGFVVGSDGTFPTLWQIDAANTAINLDAWLDATNPTLGADWALRFPGYVSDISNNGLITGWGFYYPANQYRAYLLDASSLVPEPGGLALLGLAFLALVVRHAVATPRRSISRGSGCEGVLR